jgi:manganese transport protein
MPLEPDAELVLLHVAESAASRYLGPETSDQEARQDQATLEALAAEFQARGVSASVRLGFGDVKAELARMVEESGADLLVVGSHGHRMLQDLFHGATTSDLRHRVRRPVLIVPPRDRS